MNIKYFKKQYPQADKNDLVSVYNFLCFMSLEKGVKDNCSLSFLEGAIGGNFSCKLSTLFIHTCVVCNTS